jgi:SAM-dependent methyltransferase
MASAGMFGQVYELLKPALPADRARIAAAPDLLAEALGLAAQPAAPRVLDFGCGAGSGVDTIRALIPDAAYDGVDIATSPEVDARKRRDARFHSFDGVNLPFPDGGFDIVYSRQVFEHVRHPDAAVADIFRVLRPGGLFAGSMSNLEPYHSYSIFNYTPYGVYRLLSDNGFRLIRMRPGPEGFGLTIRQITLRRIGRARLVYPMVAAAEALGRIDTRQANFLKLRFSGHICFAALKPQTNVRTR